MAKLNFMRDFEAHYGQVIPVAPGIERLTANNPSAFTFLGTNSYIVGGRSVAIIDPGPEDDAHFDALMAAIKGREVTHIVVTHTHRDHSPLARRLQDATQAITVGEGAHRPARPLRYDEVNPLAESADTLFQPDIRLVDGQAIAGDGWSLRAVLTPGHTANHAAYALEGSGTLICGDHVMAWATTIVAPPDGSMSDYMASLDKLIARKDQLLLPGHGGAITRPLPFMRALRTHRQMRETAILQRVRAGDRRISQIVIRLYADTDPRLHGAAALSVLAHLEALVDAGLVVCETVPSLSAAFQAAD